MPTTEARRGNATARVLRLVRALVGGKALDRAFVADTLRITTPAADRILRGFEKHWPELRKEQRAGRRALRLPRGDVVPDRVAVATCFGASLSRLFAGSAYESGMTDARKLVVARVRKPPLFDDFDRKFYFVRGGGERMLPAHAGLLDEIVDAVLNGNHIAMTYGHFAGGSDDLRIKPLSVVVYAHQLYVVGRDDAGKDRLYRFSRILSAERDGTTFAYPSAAEYDPDDLFADSFGVFIGTNYPVSEVVIRFDKRWEVFVRHHRWHHGQRATFHADHVLVRLRVRVCPEFESWVLGLGEEAEVLEPLELRGRLRLRAEGMAVRYARRG